MNWIDRRIRECAEKQLPELDLSINYYLVESQDCLRALPLEILELTHLKTLILDGQRIERFPPAIKELEELERISVKFSGLTSVAEIAVLPHLKELDLGGSRNVIGDLSALTGLESLDISYATIPEQFGLDRLVNLKKLRLRSVPFPSNISTLQSLETIEMQDADLLPLVKLPKIKSLTINGATTRTIGQVAELKGLERLSLEQPELDRLPLDWETSLTKLRSFALELVTYQIPPRPIVGLAGFIGTGRFDELSFRGIALSENDYSSVLANSALKSLHLDKPGIRVTISDLIHLASLDDLAIIEGETVEALESVAGLANLKSLNLSSNNLGTLPGTIGDLTNLEFLWLYNTRIRSFPNTIARLRKLKRLSLAGNGITQWPAVVCELPSLIQLVLHENAIGSVPSSISALRELEQLELKENPMTTLPEEIAHLPRLKSLGLSSESMTSPPPEIASRGLAAIQEYFDALADKDATKLYEAKLIIVGEGEVGKTCLAYKLADPKFDLEANRQLIKSTEGIHIKNWLVPTAVTDAFKVNIWDFGGQEIYHSTHQFFLTRRSLYLFVWDARKEDRLQGFDYWLNAVRLLSAGSPVIIVLNKADERIKEIDQKQISDRFPNIVGFHKVSALTGAGMQALRENICTALAALPHAGDKWPGRWNRVRQAIEKDDRNYISYEDYLAMADLEPAQAAVLSGYLHDLGVILHFQDDPLLQRIVILKPEWGTNAVYAVLDTKSIQLNNGRFRFSQLRDIWGTTKYPPSRHPELLQLMIRFELCYRLADTDEYIAPELLSAKKPDFSWNHQGNLEFEYRYTFMPAGIMTRFIARNHPAIWQNLSWRNGVVLAWEGSRALVTAEPFDKRIRIAVDGENKRDVLATIRYDIAHIHKTLNNPELEEMVPCICSTCTAGNPSFFRYSQLRGYSQNKIPDIRCEKSYQTVSVELLLTGVYRDMELAASTVTGKPAAHPGEPVQPPAPPPLAKAPLPNAWRSGSFPLFVFLAGCAIAVSVSILISPWMIPVVVLSGICAVCVVGAFQLKQDDRLSDESFLKLMAMSLRQLPVLLKSR